MPLLKPDYLKVKLKVDKEYAKVVKLLKKYNLKTVCQEAFCPNRNECFSNGTATFLLMGDICTRGCRFCNIKKGKPLALDFQEVVNILKAIDILKLDYVVLTSVSRDDLPLQGADYLSKAINYLKTHKPNIILEALLPDFQGKEELLDLILNTKLDVFNHNVETVERITPLIRDKRASYKQSLKVLRYFSKHNVLCKSGLMVGLGEKEEEVIKTLKDLSNVGCKIITIGQYLQPSKKHYPVKRYVSLNTFKYYKEEGEKLGLKVVSSPFVRSSYNAKKLFWEVKGYEN